MYIQMHIRCLLFLQLNVNSRIFKLIRFKTYYGNGLQKTGGLMYLILLTSLIIMRILFYVKEDMLREIRKEIKLLVGNPQGRDKGMSLN